MDLEKKATYGLVSPETYNLPSPVPLWEAAFENKEHLPNVKEDAVKSVSIMSKCILILEVR